MSVFQRKGTPNYHYEFQLQGVRFRGSTGETSRRSAERAEARIRADAEEKFRAGLSPAGHIIQMTLGEAVTRYWLEKGEHEANAATTWYQLENLVDGLGRTTLMSQISMSDLAEYQARRRGQKNRRGNYPANRSVNAEVPELLSRIYKRARTVWSDRARGTQVALGGEKDWASLKLRVPKGRVRELKADEEAKLAEHLRADYAPIIEFATISGLRRSQLILKWPQCDFGARVIHYRRKSLHDNDMGVLPMSDRMWQILQAQKGHHRTHVFTYVCKRTREGRRKGHRYPITESGLATEMRRSVADAGLEDWRLLHDLRHTAATRTLRASQNLKAVQSMLGHAEIASTARYAHAMLEDVRAALDAASPRKIPTLVENEPAKLGHKLRK